MTIASSQAKAGPFIADGKTSVYPFPFRVLSPSHIEVVYEGAIPDYDVQVLENGGNVVFRSPVTAGTVLAILRNVPITQETDLQNHTAFLPEVLEDSLDKVTMICQQLAEELDRCIKSSATDENGLNSLIQSIYEARNAAVAASNSAASYKSSAQSSATSAQGYANTAKKYSEEAKANLSGYLPLSGGTLTGNLFTTAGIYNTASNASFFIACGGGAGENTHIQLTGSNHGEAPDRIALVAGDLSGAYSRLHIYKDKRCTFGGKDMTLGHPKYSAGVNITVSASSGYTATQDGWIWAQGRVYGNAWWEIYVNGGKVGDSGHGSGYDFMVTNFFPIHKGDKITYGLYGENQATLTFIYYPFM